VIDSLSLPEANVLHNRRALGGERRFHFHRLNHDEGLSRLDEIAVVHEHLEDLAGHRRGDCCRGEPAHTPSRSSFDRLEFERRRPN